MVQPKSNREYKELIFHAIIQLSGLSDISINTSIEETIRKLRLNDPLIIQGNLLNEEDKLYVSCDIIIRYDLFKKIFCNIKL